MNAKSNSLYSRQGTVHPIPPSWQTCGRPPAVRYAATPLSAAAASVRCYACYATPSECATVYGYLEFRSGHAQRIPMDKQLSHMNC